MKIEDIPRGTPLQPKEETRRKYWFGKKVGETIHVQYVFYDGRKQREDTAYFSEKQFKEFFSDELY